MWCEIFEPEDRLDCQALQMLEESQGCGRHFAQCGYVVGPGEASRDGPFEQRHTFLGGNGLQQRPYPLLFHRFDDNQRVARANEGAEIVDAG